MCSKPCSSVGLREEENLLSLHHANIVRFLGIVRVPNDPADRNIWFLMELCDTDLAALIASTRKLQELEVAWILHQVKLDWTNFLSVLYGNMYFLDPVWGLVHAPQ